MTINSASVTAAVWTAVTFYFTAIAATTGIYGVTNDTTAGHTARFDDLSVKEVTHPGTDGVHIVASYGSATRDWTEIEAGFVYNDTSYTFEVFRCPLKEIEAATFLASYDDHELKDKFFRFTSGDQDGDTYRILDNVGNWILLDASAVMDGAWDADTFAVFGDHVSHTFTGGAYRYMRIVIDAQQTADDYYQIGTMVAGRAVTLTDAFGIEYDDDHAFGTALIDTPAGGLVAINDYPRKRKLSLGYVASDAGRKQMLALLNYLEGKNIALVLDSTASAECSLVKLKGDAAQVHQFGDYFSLELEFEEVL